jgi:hypothetical protein
MVIGSAAAKKQDLTARCVLENRRSAAYFAAVLRAG